MSIGYLLVALALLSLLIYRFLLGTDSKAATRVLAVALLVGTVHYGLQTALAFLPLTQLAATVLIVNYILYVLFFLLLALHYTSRQLPAAGYWIPQIAVTGLILATAITLQMERAYNASGYAELVRTLLLGSATLAFVSISRSKNMLNEQPVFWIPTLIVSTCFGIATGVKLLATLLYFTGSGAAGLLSTISTMLGGVATLTLLLFLGANLSWLKQPA